MSANWNLSLRQTDIFCSKQIFILLLSGIRTMVFRIHIYPKQHPSGPQVMPSPMIVKGVIGSASFTSGASSVPKILSSRRMSSFFHHPSDYGTNSPASRCIVGGLLQLVLCLLQSLHKDLHRLSTGDCLHSSTGIPYPKKV